jgi:hypothetical protein
MHNCAGHPNDQRLEKGQQQICIKTCERLSKWLGGGVRPVEVCNLQSVKDQASNNSIAFGQSLRQQLVAENEHEKANSFNSLMNSN